MENKRCVDVILGLQFGDEGKGKIINEMASEYDVNVRYQGGANSGHTIWLENGEKVVFNVLPSGMLNPGITGVITQGVVINPLAFTHEVDRVGIHVKNIKERLYISKDVHMTLPVHILLDIFTEMSRSTSGVKTIGSTNRGNTPTYVDRVARRGIRLSDIAHPDFMDKYNKLTNYHIKHIKNDHPDFNLSDVKVNGMPYLEYEGLWLKAVERMNEFMYCNTVALLHEMCAEGRRILLEGAQGLMLDIEYGTYPFVTSSSVTASAAFAQTGIPPQMINRVYGVFKPYITRVGSGFFPTIMNDDIKEESVIADHIVEIGKEFGSVTGRKRMIGWLDMPQLKYACMVNGVTDLIMMKCDVLSDIPGNILVCESYEYQGDDNYTDVYEGEDHFRHAVMKEFPKFGDLTVLPKPFWGLVKYINDYFADVITDPEITAVSCSPTAKSIKISRS